VQQADATITLRPRMSRYRQPPSPRDVFAEDASADRVAGRRRVRSKPRLCASCGCVLASDNGGTRCSPCACREPYDPRTDGQFPRRLAAYLARHVGRTVNPCAYFNVVESARYYVHRRVRQLSGCGWEIVGVRGVGGGYMVVRTPQDATDAPPPRARMGS